MNNNLKDLKESSAVQNHINILQNIITRMASNSANSKTWAITIISAIIVLLIDKNKIDMIDTAYIPLAMFFFLDCFYLGLEKYFRDEYKNFIDKLKTSSFDFDDIYNIKGPGLCDKICYTLKGMWSCSTTPFYAIFAILILILKVS
jgi:methyl coenzyme M reductase subunit C-like uncharacterized protein (methanogenesis marker protein 7)